jgi:hypothetical protein
MVDLLNLLTLKGFKLLGISAGALKNPSAESDAAGPGILASARELCSRIIPSTRRAKKKDPPDGESLCCKRYCFERVIVVL